MKLWIWVIIGALILGIIVITGFWQHLFNQAHNDTPSNLGFRVNSNDTMIPAVKGYSDGSPTIKQDVLFRQQMIFVYLEELVLPLW